VNSLANSLYFLIALLSFSAAAAPCLALESRLAESWSGRPQRSSFRGLTNMAR
jgi:NosR/NirI family transcriptional regulator, nitrous oxide reductase regulator